MAMSADQPDRNRNSTTIVWVPVALPKDVQVDAVFGTHTETGVTYKLEIVGRSAVEPMKENQHG